MVLLKSSLTFLRPFRSIEATNGLRSMFCQPNALSIPGTFSSWYLLNICSGVTLSARLSIPSLTLGFTFRVS